MIAVLIKQVPDTETKIRLSSPPMTIETKDVKWIINPYDEFAIEEAIRTQEKHQMGGTLALSLGPDRSVEALRTALAMGIDQAIHIKCDEELDTWLTAQALGKALALEKVTVLFSGKQAIDDDQGAVTSYVAEYLGWPSITCVSKLEWNPKLNQLRAEREMGSGLTAVIESSLPVCLSIDKGINTPRYASLPGIMRAKKKEIKTYTLEQLEILVHSRKVQDGELELPKERPPGKKILGDPVTQAKELVRLLREEAKVI